MPLHLVNKLVHEVGQCLMRRRHCDRMKDLTGKLAKLIFLMWKRKRADEL